MIGRTKQRWVGIAVLAVTFLAGGVAGMAVRELTADPAPRADRAGTEARRDDGNSSNRRRFPYEVLGIEGEQRAQIEAVFERRRTEMSALWHDYQPRMDAVVDSTRAEVHRLLTPEQQEKYDEYRKQRREQREREEKQQQQSGSGNDK